MGAVYGRSVLVALECGSFDGSGGAMKPADHGSGDAPMRLLRFGKG